MQQRDIPLYALESKDPLGMFDVVGFTLQHELSYTNILAMLDLAHIPFMQRTEGRMRRSLWRAARACATPSRWRIFLT